MLELKRITTNKRTVNNCTIESVICDTVNVKTVKQERTFKKQYLKSVYGLDSHYINIVHYDGRKKRIDIYALAFYCTFKTLRKATTKRAMELFDNKYSYCVHDWQDMICTGVDYCLYGYVDGNGKYHKGYYTDKISTVKELTGVIYSAINSVIYAKGVTGKWTGKEVLTEDYREVKTVVNLFNFINTNCTNINSVKWNMFINDVRNSLTNKQLQVFDCILDNEYVNTEIKADNSIDFSTDLIAIQLDKSKSAISHIIKRITEKCNDIINKYNMNTQEFIDYLSA